MAGRRVDFPLSPDGKPIVTVRFTGPAAQRTVEVLVDSGATRTMIHSALARALGYHIEGRHADGSVEGIGVRKVPYWKEAAGVCLTNGEVELEWEAEIGITDAKLPQAVLGRKDVFDYHTVVFEPSPKRVVFEAADNFPGLFRQR